MDEQIDTTKIYDTLAPFGGLWRRMEYLGMNSR
jgi:hypothetical protein